MMITSETLTGQAPRYCMKIPINTQSVTSHPGICDVSTQLCGRWFQTQTTAVVSAEALCCIAAGSVVCVEAGKCQELSWWFRSDQIWNMSGCCMHTDIRNLKWTAQSWMELKTIQKSWFFNQEGQCMWICAKICAKQRQGTMQPSGWPEVEKPQNRSSKKAGCFSNLTQLDKYYVIYKSLKKNSKLQKATRLLTIDIQYYIRRPYPFLCQPTNSHSVLAVWYGLLHHQLQQNLCRPRHSCIDCYGHQWDTR